MFRGILNTYRSSFKGLSKEVWWLALITFINRAGTMVLPFLSLYLNKYLEFSLGQVGWIMSAFGVGSVIGSWLGGKLTDKLGFRGIMFWSLFITAFLFVGLQYITSFAGFCLGITATMIVADTFRPAMFVSLKAYSTEATRTRSLTLIRLAINLGFSMGPALGGLIITYLNYQGLFWVDGITCLIAALLLLEVLPKTQQESLSHEENSDEVTGVFADKTYVIFWGMIFLMAFIFMQLFTTLPLYYKEVHHLSESEIGWLLSLNGFLIFLLEMPLVHRLENNGWNQLKIIAWSLVLMSLTYLILNLSAWKGILVISIIFITLGEMLAFPFTNAFAMKRAPQGKEGIYMAWYTMAFSIAHILSAKTGMEIIDREGYAANWYLMTLLGALAIVLCLWLMQRQKREKSQNS